MERYQFTAEQRALMERMQMPFAIYQFLDKRVVTLVLSDGFCKLFGYEDRAQAYYDMDNDMYKDTHPDDAARVANAAFRFAVEGGKYEVIYRSKNGSGYRIIHAAGEHVYTDTGVRLAHIWYTDEGSYSAGSSTHTVELNRELNTALHEESLRNANYYDYLTGLPCITYFFELAEAGRMTLREKGEVPVILFMDLSGMKFFNRRHGFSAGDRLLRAFARLLANTFSNENCSRFGQDHFAVFTSETGLEQKLDKLLADARSINDGCSLPVRVGIYRDQLEAVDVSTACDRARFACDVRRSALVSSVSHFDSSMLLEVERRQHILNNLDRAIRERWIQVHYQPIVRAVNGRVCDEEALSRWMDPEMGMLHPVQFVPVLEDAGLIYKLDLCVVEQVLEKLLAQQGAGLHLVPQSINLSRADFDACDIVEEIRRRVDDAGISRSLVTIEITESMVGSDFDFMREQIGRFRALGFPVWMDDFGSGYSSLDVLQSIPFDLIKFDMRFMQRFDEGEAGQIILSELMKMATALRIDTVCEGVETAAQVQFLREAGCSKLQGYYYCRPISFDQILDRYRKGAQIGYEDPRESAYYEAIGRVNLYDLATIVNEGDSTLQKFFSTLPMAILEIKGDRVRFVRSNQSYRDFMQRRIGFDLSDEDRDFSATPEDRGISFMTMVRQCCESGNRSFIEEKLPDGTSIQSFVRMIAANPVAGTSAVAVAVLSVRDADEGASYADIARALAADYFNLFYVDLQTEEFIEYSSGVGEEALSMERHGTDFFNEGRKDAMRFLYPEDRERFVLAFTKENVLRRLDEQGTFRLTYRLLQEGEPVYVTMKIMRMGAESKYIIVGVSNIDAQMKQKEMLDRIRQDQVTYARISALSGSFICLYTVDLATNHYAEYSASSDYRGLGLARQGEDFFADAQKNGLETILPDDLPLFRRGFTREQVLCQVERHGLYTLRYRLKLGKSSVPVLLRAAVVKEGDGEKLIVGVNNLDLGSPLA